MRHQLIVDLALCKLPYMETLYEQANEEAGRKQDGVDYLENRKYSLKKEISSLEEGRRKKKKNIRIILLWAQ